MVFTRKEKGLLYDPYFAVIRETEQFIEVRSLNTGHCWNVFKNTIEAGKKVTLYHKHKQSDPYYSNECSYSKGWQLDGTYRERHHQK